MHTSTTSDMEPLLAETGWIQDVALQLVTDVHLAEDIAQDTCVAALLRRPASDRSLRGWLRTVVRNFARQGRRRDAARSRFDRVTRLEDVAPSTLEVIERAAVHREVMNALLALDEPFRATILLRFLDGKPPREIARQMQVPVATVRSRLQRGLQRLRLRLDEEYGGRSAWLALFLTHALPASLPAAWKTSIGAALVNMKLVIGVIAVVAIGSLAVFLNDERASQELEQASVGTVDSRSEGLPGSNHDRRETRRQEETPISKEPSTADPKPAAHDALPIMKGRVVHAEGHPVAGVEVGFTDVLPNRGDPIPSDASVAIGTTGLDGTFSFQARETTGSLVVRDPRYATIAAAVCRPSRDQTEMVVLAAGRVGYAGQVVDDVGRPLADAHIAFALPAGFRNRFDQVLDHSVSIDRGTTTDESGQFTLDEVPVVEGALLTVNCKGFLLHREPAPDHDHRQLRFALQKRAHDEHSVTGWVKDAEGAFVEGATVSLGFETALTNELGEFEFNLQNERSANRRFGVEPLKIIAVKEGYLPSAEQRAEKPTEGGNPWPDPVELRLGSNARSIEGQVLDDRGEARAGLRVWVADTTLFGAIDGRPAMLEGIMAGRGRDRWGFVETDADGRFRVDGLLDRVYVVEAMDPETLLRVKERVAAGTRNASLRLPGDAMFEALSGRVVSVGGKPIVGAAVRTMCDGFVARYEGNPISTSHASGGQVMTDEQGRFRFERVPRNLVYLRVDGEHTLSVEFGRRASGLEEAWDGPIEDIEIVAPLRCHLKVSFEPKELGDGVQILDQEGEPITIDVIMGTSRRSYRTAPIRDGESEVLAIPESARTVILIKDGEEVRRLPLQLTPGKVTRLRF